MRLGSRPPGPRPPAPRLRVTGTSAQDASSRFDPRPRGRGGRAHTHCSFARASPAPFRPIRTGPLRQGGPPSPAIARFCRRPRGHRHPSRERCFSPTRATDSRHEHSYHRPTPVRGSSPRRPHLPALCRQARAPRRARLGPRWARDLTPRSQLPPATSLRAPRDAAPLGMSALGLRPRAPLRDVVDRASSRDDELLTPPVAPCASLGVHRALRRDRGPSSADPSRSMEGGARSAFHLRIGGASKLAPLIDVRPTSRPAPADDALSPARGSEEQRQARPTTELPRLFTSRRRGPNIARRLLQS